MSNIVKYSTASTPNPITDYLPSVNTPDYSSLPNVLVNPDLSAVSGQPMKYWKHVSGTVQLMTTAEQASVDAAEVLTLLTLQRNGALITVDSSDADGKLDRAIVLSTVDALNTIREWIMSFKAAVAASTSLANLQTRVAALLDTPDITGAQVRTSIKGHINDGSADN